MHRFTVVIAMVATYFGYEVAIIRLYTSSDWCGNYTTYEREKFSPGTYWLHHVYQKHKQELTYLWFTYSYKWLVGKTSTIHIKVNTIGRHIRTLSIWRGYTPSLKHWLIFNFPFLKITYSNCLIKYLEEYMVLNTKTGNGKVGRTEN
jgi:hypothetical protein